MLFFYYHNSHTQINFLTFKTTLVSHAANAVLQIGTDGGLE